MTTALLHLSPSRRSVSSRDRETDQGKPSGFTLVELLVAMCVSLLLLGGVVSLFGTLGESVNNSKSNSEMLQTMRHTARQLQSDLGNVSLVPDPAQTMVDPQGFFEYVEGPQNDANLKPEPVAELPDPIVMDNTGSNFDSAHAQGQIPWGIYTNNEEASQGYGGDAAWRECPLKIRTWGPEQASWTRSGLDAGMYKVWMTWPIHHKEWRRISGIPYSITAGDESTGGTIDQTALPSGEEYDGKNWQELAEIQLTAGEDLVIKLGAIDAQFGSSGGPLVLADAVRIQCQDCTEEGGSAATMNLVGDCDDVLHFTTKKDEGAYEVVWFLTPMKGHENKPAADKRYRLHRRELKVDPHAPTTTESLSLGYQEPMPADWSGGYDDFNNWQETAAVRTPNTLEALARRYNRNAHVPKERRSAAQAGEFVVNQREDYQSSLESEFIDDAGNDRIGKTVILENVIAFNVQAYDPTVPIYSTTSDGQTVSLSPTDPGWQAAHQVAKQAAEDQGLASIFDLSPPPTDVGPIGKGAFRDLDPTQSDDTHSPLQTLNTANGFVATYDSWSGDYVKTFDHDENSGTEEVPGDVGFDNDGNGIVDTAEDLREPPPYVNPLRAVQVEIRMQEPESGKVRSVKVRKFLGKR
jgi:prepilin-type N-terminal cleavage/methylation domain-containing protein